MTNSDLHVAVLQICRNVGQVVNFLCSHVENNHGNISTLWLVIFPHLSAMNNLGQKGFYQFSDTEI